jgi:hypothetical protein
MFMRLREHRVNRTTKEKLTVEYRHADADGRPFGGLDARD